METVELSAEEARVNQQAKALLDALWNNAEHGQAFKKLIKAVNPRVSIPEVDIPDAVTKPYDEKIAAQAEEIAALRKALEDDQKARKERDEENDLVSKFDRIRKEYDLTDDGMDKVRKLMVDRQIPDPEAAAALYLRQTPPAPSQPSTVAPPRWDFQHVNDDDADQKLLWSNPEAWADREAAAVMQELKIA